MMRRSFAMFAAVSLVTVSQATVSAAQDSRPGSGYPDQQERYSADQLDNLVGPIALYPDALLAQVLVAATFPDQVDDAARFVRANGTSQIDDQAWDVSVKAVAHYPSALNTMADKPDWTTTLGRAYAMQSSDVMLAVQRMRAMADSQGNLRTTQQQTVSRENDAYVIAPSQPQVIYVPVYDPYVIYTRPIFDLGYYSPYWSFGIGFPIGGWLSYDCNWRSRSVYYNGWNRSYYGYAGGWRGRSAPYIHISNVYVNSRYENVYINRDVIRHQVEYRNVDRYAGVHRDTRFGSRAVDYRNGRDNVRDLPQDRSRYNTVDNRGGYVPNDNRGNNRGNNGAPQGAYDNGNRGRDPGRPTTVPEQNRGGWNRDVNSNGTWGRDGGQRQAQQDQPRPSRPEMAPPVQAPVRDRGPAAQPAPESRGPWQRNETPNVTPRRIERTEAPRAPSGNNGQQGGQRGGQSHGGGGHERPRV